MLAPSPLPLLEKTIERLPCWSSCASSLPLPSRPLPPACSRPRRRRSSARLLRRSRRRRSQKPCRSLRVPLQLASTCTRDCARWQRRRSSCALIPAPPLSLIATSLRPPLSEKKPRASPTSQPSEKKPSAACVAALPELACAPLQLASTCTGENISSCLHRRSRSLATEEKPAVHPLSPSLSLAVLEKTSALAISRSRTGEDDGDGEDDAVGRTPNVGLFVPLFRPLFSFFAVNI